MLHILHNEALAEPCDCKEQVWGEPCYGCYLRGCRAEEMERRATQEPEPACLQIPLPNLEALASLPF